MVFLLFQIFPHLSVFSNVFPASATTGEIRCNPLVGYTEPRYKFFRVLSFGDDTKFSAAPGCSTANNPTLFVRPPRLGSPEFTMYDAQAGKDGIAAAGDGWQLARVEDLRRYAAEFIAAYNNAGGLRVLRPFASRNCCIALRGGKMLTIGGMSRRCSSSKIASRNTDKSTFAMRSKVQLAAYSFISESTASRCSSVP